MKTIFLALIICCATAFSVHAQLKDTQPTPPAPDLQEKAAGFELVTASRHYYTGIILDYSGGIVFIVGAAEIAANSNSGGGLVLLGSLAMITGTVFTIESYGHIGRAGKILMQRNDLTFGPTHNGLGLSVRF